MGAYVEPSIDKLLSPASVAIIIGVFGNLYQLATSKNPKWLALPVAWFLLSLGVYLVPNDKVVPALQYLTATINAFVIWFATGVLTAILGKISSPAEQHALLANPSPPTGERRKLLSAWF
jgi:hypothetical protein